MMKIAPLALAAAAAASFPRPAFANALGEAILDAQRAWRLIENNRPSLQVRSSYASALPDGVSDWRMLTDWSSPEVREYGFSAKNMIGMTVVEVRYQVLRCWGGRLAGRGRYLASIAVVPTKIEVELGYRLDVSVELASVTNVGSVDDPIAAAILELRWRITSAIKHQEGRSSYYLRGDGSFRDLGGMSLSPIRESAAAALAAAASTQIP